MVGESLGAFTDDLDAVLAKTEAGEAAEVGESPGATTDDLDAILAETEAAPKGADGGLELTAGADLPTTDPDE